MSIVQKTKTVTIPLVYAVRRNEKGEQTIQTHVFPSEIPQDKVKALDVAGVGKVGAERDESVDEAVIQLWKDLIVSVSGYIGLSDNWKEEVAADKDGKIDIRNAIRGLFTALTPQDFLGK